MSTATKNKKTTKQQRIEELKNFIYDTEQKMYDNLDAPEYLTDHYFDYWTDDDAILKAFISNYKPSDVISIINFKSDYQSQEAIMLIKKLGRNVILDLIKNNIYTKMDDDVYREHWNDLASDDYSEYEIQVDRNDDIPQYKEYFDLIESDSDWFYISLGQVRAKLDVESFDKEIAKLLK